MVSISQVAIKKMKKKFFTWEECMQLREVKVINDRFRFFRGASPIILLPSL